MQFWPRKRAKRIYPRTSFWPASPETNALGFAGWKAGMTHLQLVDTNAKSKMYGKIVSVAGTVLDIPPLFVLGVVFYTKTPHGTQCSGRIYAEGVPRGIDIKRKGVFVSTSTVRDGDDVRLIVCTQPGKGTIKKQKPDVFEIGIGGSSDKKAAYALSLLGKELHAQDIFKEGDIIDVSAVTRGFGFTGPVKRFGIRIQTRKDKQMHRHTGSIGSTTPRKVDYRVPLPGQHGFHNRTETGKRVLVIGNDGTKATPAGGFVGYGPVKEFMVIEGSVPGPRKRLIRLRRTIRFQPPRVPDVKSISLTSKQ